MRKQIAFGAIAGLTLLLGGHDVRAEVTICQASMGELQTGGVLVAGYSNVVGAVAAEVTNFTEERILQRFDLIGGPESKQGSAERRIGSFAGLAEFEALPGQVFRVTFTDDRHVGLCSVTLRVKRLVDVRGMLFGGVAEVAVVDSEVESDQRPGGRRP